MSDKEAADQDDQTRDAIQVPLKWPLDKKLSSVYANQFSITKANAEYIIEFGEFLPTGFVNRSEEELKQYLEGAMIEPVARIIVSPKGLDAFSKMLDRYVIKQGLSGEKQEVSDE